MLQLVVILALIGADPDKSLAPDGKPWTAESLTTYLHGQLKEGDPFKLVKEIKMELGPGGKKREAVVSASKPRTKLIEKVTRKHKLDENPGRGIIVFDKRQQLMDLWLKNTRSRQALLLQMPGDNLANPVAQALYWGAAVEILDFHGDEEAAQDYADSFKSLPGVDHLNCTRWYGLTLSGDKGSVRSLGITLDRYPGFVQQDAPK